MVLTSITFQLDPISRDTTGMLAYSSHPVTIDSNRFVNSDSATAQGTDSDQPHAPECHPGHKCRRSDPVPAGIQMRPFQATAVISSANPARLRAGVFLVGYMGHVAITIRSSWRISTYVTTLGSSIPDRWLHWFIAIIVQVNQGGIVPYTCALAITVPDTARQIRSVSRHYGEGVETVVNGRFRGNGRNVGNPIHSDWGSAIMNCAAAQIRTNFFPCIPISRLRDQTRIRQIFWISGATFW